MTQLYWQVYLNLERDFLSIADTIHINDKQQEVYSMKIADLLIRTAVEIEALAKELYLANDGEVKEAKKMFFDSVCLKHLNKLWELEQKVVMVVSPAIYFEKEENKVLKPLYMADKRGPNSSDWKDAYQAIKHNRVNDLTKGSIKHLLHGLAALYVLNLYYRNESIKNISSDDMTSVNPSFGSSLFAVKIHKGMGIKEDGSYHKSPDYDECVYIEDYERNSKKYAMKTMSEMRKKYNDLLSDVDPKLPELILECFRVLLRYDIVLNKQQY
ncbi:MAG: hypothetical protein K6F48_02435 [Paludibacteraceae bacterium]|nr:hypothetical protein [Paludibacteraceae bacterium]